MRPPAGMEARIARWSYQVHQKTPAEDLGGPIQLLSCLHLLLLACGWTSLVGSAGNHLIPPNLREGPQ